MYIQLLLFASLRNRTLAQFLGLALKNVNNSRKEQGEYMRRTYLMEESSLEVKPFGHGIGQLNSITSFM